MASTDSKPETKQAYVPTNAAGAFVRPVSAYRSAITADGSSGFPAEEGRYHLYLSPGCPWCHRVMIAIPLKGLQHAISSSFVGPQGPIDDAGTTSWIFDEQHKDPLFGKKNLKEVYLLGNPEHNGRYTVPLFWDKKTNKIVNNESSDLLKFLNTEMDKFAKNKFDYRPESLLKDIEAWNDTLYNGLNNGVYRCGFAQSQAAYDGAVRDVFATLDKLEERLSKSRYLAGDRITESDIRAYPTLVRFDVAYNILFKCSLRRISDYPHLSNYVRDLYTHAAFKGSTDVDSYKLYYQMKHLNPTGIVALVQVDFSKAHNRDELFPAKSS